MKRDKRVTVAVLMGGTSSEREVSLHSGAGIVDALRKARFDVVPAVMDDLSLASIEGQGVDVAFIALHGGFGEDGRVQRLLEDAGIPYTGSGPEASHSALDKVIAKRKFVEAGIPVVRDRLLDSVPDRDSADRIVCELGGKVVVKPAAQGSSIGVSIVERGGFDAAVREALVFDGRVIVESFVKGRELTVGVLGREALPVIELRPHRQFFDYTAKYQYGQTEYIVDPDLPDDLKAGVSRAALAAFESLACRDLGRVDMMLAENDGFFVLEVNTIPGFTETSLVPMAAKAVGIDFPALCGRLVEMALERFGAARPV